jgi:hypothetical protein
MREDERVAAVESSGENEKIMGAGGIGGHLGFLWQQGGGGKPWALDSPQGNPCTHHSLHTQGGKARLHLGLFGDSREAATGNGRPSIQSNFFTVWDINKIIKVNMKPQISGKLKKSHLNQNILLFGS